jgi:hypothetical protein
MGGNECLFQALMVCEACVLPTLRYAGLRSEQEGILAAFG